MDSDWFLTITPATHLNNSVRTSLVILLGSFCALSACFYLFVMMALSISVSLCVCFFLFLLI